MKTFQTISLDRGRQSQELDELEAFLTNRPRLKERAEILPFFAHRAHLSAALGFFRHSVDLPDRVAFELDLFGDFVCDVASGDSLKSAFVLTEFEDATDTSIFLRLKKGGTMKQWSPRFEHGFSQLVNWAWRLSTEGPSAAHERIFGGRNATIQLLLIAGRDGSLTNGDLARLEWRSEHISLGAFRMSCLTFDGVLSSLRRRLSLWREG